MCKNKLLTNQKHADTQIQQLKLAIALQYDSYWKLALQYQKPQKLENTRKVNP